MWTFTCTCTHTHTHSLSPSSQTPFPHIAHIYLYRLVSLELLSVVYCVDQLLSKVWPWKLCYVCRFCWSRVGDCWYKLTWLMSSITLISIIKLSISRHVHQFPLNNVVWGEVCDCECVSVRFYFRHGEETLHNLPVYIFKHIQTRDLTKHNTHRTPCPKIFSTREMDYCVGICVCVFMTSINVNLGTHTIFVCESVMHVTSV